MTQPYRKIPDRHATMRRRLFAGVLGLGFAVLWPGVAAAGQGYQSGPQVVVESVTDDGGGVIRISWSLEPVSPDVVFQNSRPHKVCVWWSAVVNGSRGPATEKCFTGEASSQADLLIDTGIGGDGPATVYSVVTVPYYNNVPFWPLDDDDVMKRVEVTLNG